MPWIHFRGKLCASGPNREQNSYYFTETDQIAADDQPTTVTTRPPFHRERGSPDVHHLRIHSSRRLRRKIHEYISVPLVELQEQQKRRIGRKMGATRRETILQTGNF
ncbi:hypothetical protein NECAME_09248 [Necator americanus]|uniref:Uncharacterized protein n=1 Tax=Necator americanus TaxID=51031 RepID=W2TFJ0_NECAM|nr:hypothetical protein NECAME_09248 [Necator americanus]ETN80354.1 hypothetical protein NECAME_09248 [Necator americanus]